MAEGNSRTILDLLDNAASIGNAKIRFLPDDASEYSLSEIISAAHSAAGWWLSKASSGSRVSVVMPTSFDGLAVAFGAWLAGLTLVSLPHPSKGVTPEQYLSTLEDMCKLAESKVIVIERAYSELLPRLPMVAIDFFDSYKGTPPLKVIAGGGELIQFTSGATAEPKAVVLGMEAIGNSVSGCLDVLGPREQEAAVSWLPLSHDMGFIGICLTALAATGPPWSTRGSLTLIRPEEFLRDPRIWMKTCSDFGATITAAPNFALAIATRLLRAGGPTLDLSALRTFIIGAETIRPDTLRDFATVARPHGFSELSFCPAYGLAEATLAVTLVPPETMWSTTEIEFESDSPSSNMSTVEWQNAFSGRKVVSCGKPIPGIEVRIKDDASIGQIEIMGSSLLTRYAGHEQAAASESGWFQTGDIGMLCNSELFVFGRGDDVLIIRGRNFSPETFEAIAGEHPLIRAGNCVAIPDGEGDYVIVAEIKKVANITGEELETCCREIRVALAKTYGAGPSRVVLIQHNSMPKTASGKLQRSKVARCLLMDELVIAASS
ncbi:MAG: AMP-binding protein [Acidimicrobiales bacterium]|nr:AMP-binding protein [Acidimicrobiales bacterium]